MNLGIPEKPEKQTVVGVDACEGGWICFVSTGRLGASPVEVVADIGELLGKVAEAQVFAIDIPIGLSDAGSRQCDLEARSLLGRPRCYSVFPAPVRSVLKAKTYQEACELSYRAHGKKISKQALAILPKIRQVDRLMSPELQVSIFEVHPELCFWALNGQRPLQYSKHSESGQKERLVLLVRHFPDIQRHIDGLNRREAMADDLLDAAAAAWTAQRIAAGVAGRIPFAPEVDRKGLRMEMWY